ncbi:MAG: right-handed parallel beta-helix repeat-containing protein [bacterium]
MKQLLSISLFVVFSGFSCFAAIIRVPEDQPTIQAGIDAAVDGDTVLVADGTYTGEGNRKITFTGKAITVQSENGPEQTVVDCEETFRGFSFRSGETNASILRGFTIVNGFTEGLGRNGSGISINGASPTIENCIIKNCVSKAAHDEGVYYFPALGGGMYISGSPVLINCVFMNNHAYDYGGAIYCASGSVTISDTIFEGNGAVYGGAIYGKNVSITSCTFQRNIAAYGGAINCRSEAIIGGSQADGNYFDNNRAAVGADLFCEDNPESPIIASYNTFTGYFPSDYYITPIEKFDLSGCTSLLTPLTQDVYISCDGDDSNTGLSWDQAFKTVHYAVSRVYGTRTNPVTVHIAPGYYSPSSTQETFPLPIVSHVHLKGEDMFESVFNDEGTGGGFIAHEDQNISIAYLSIYGGLYLKGLDAKISNCLIEKDPVIIGDNYKYTVYAHSDSLTINDCIIRRSYGYLEADTYLNVLNCFFYKNMGKVYDHFNLPFNATPAITLSSPLTTISNCSFFENSTGPVCSVLRFSNSVINNSIFWNQSMSEIEEIEFNGDCSVQFSNIKGGAKAVFKTQGSTLHWGEGMIDSDPLFTEGTYGNFYLSSTAAGQPMDSPCIDSGSDLSMNVCYPGSTGTTCMNNLTTRTDHIADYGIVDMGFHYTSSGWLGTRLELSQDNYFRADDIFWLKCHVSINYSLTDIPIAIVLGVGGEYWFWWPKWTEDFETIPTNFEPGLTSFYVFEPFVWPVVDGHVEGLEFYSALLTPDISNIIGEFGHVVFGYTDR